MNIIWMRRDLRIADHPALIQATREGKDCVALFILSEEEEGEWPIVGASKWWLHYSLLSLKKELENKKISLILRKGDPRVVLRELVKQLKAKAVFWNRRYEPFALKLEKEVAALLSEEGVEGEVFPGNLLAEPWQVISDKGTPYQVFTPFWKKFQATCAPATPLPLPMYKGSLVKATSLTLDELELLPKKNWATGFSFWQPGERGAWKRLEGFAKKGLEKYLTDRDFPAVEGVSELSPHLHFGEISPRSIWYYLNSKPHAEGFLRQLGWREFAHHLLYHFPRTPKEPLREAFREFPWVKDRSTLEAWQKGKTGYPIVDAGMRQLWQTGWMHNRVRMIVGSFLVKDLRISWLEGAHWFWDTLVDADLANNTLGWQWVGGCGADAAPYFRVFNPVSQSKKFDPEGHYLRKYLPELARLPTKWIHEPWLAPPSVLETAGVVLGDHYPHPIVDHAVAREAALQAFRSIGAKDA